MLFSCSIFSLPLEYNLALLLLVCESPSSSAYTTQPLDSELFAVSSILFVDDNRNLQRRVIFHVRLSRNYCTRIRLRVTADTSSLGCS